MTNWLLNNVRASSSDLLVDVGANFGWYTCLLAKKFCDSEVYAFEPEKDAFSLLNRNVTQNSLHNVHSFGLALGSSMGSLKLYVSGSGNTGTHSAVNLADSSHMVEVDMKPLDAMIPMGHEVAFMKIDAEGSEYDVLMGAQRVLERTRLVMLEFTPNLLVRMGVEPGRLLDLMTNSGFKFGYLSADDELVITEKYDLLSEAATQPLWQRDLIFFRG
jgi:FkbM family methyltransferase